MFSIFVFVKVSTAENIAVWLWNQIQEVIPPPAALFEVKKPFLSIILNNSKYVYEDEMDVQGDFLTGTPLKITSFFSVSKIRPTSNWDPP